MITSGANKGKYLAIFKVICMCKSIGIKFGLFIELCHFTSLYYYFFSHKNLHFLSGQGFDPLPLSNMSAKNVIYFGTAPFMRNRENNLLGYTI